MNAHLIKITPIILLAALPAALLGADLSLNRSFSDQMVLQRDKPIVVRGTADAGKVVSVHFASRTGSAKANEEGAWRVALEALPAERTPQKLTVSSGGQTITLKDILVGDVFLHARQSMIDLSLGRDEAGRKLAASRKADPMLRTLHIRMIPTDAPRQDLAAEATSGWSIVEAESALKMTASAYHLGHELARETGVPIGIIDLEMGSAYPRSWLSRKALMETHKYYMNQDGEPEQKVAMKVEQLEQLLEAERKGEAIPRGKDGGPRKNLLKHPLFPYAGYRGTLLPLAETALKAVVLQLGNDYPYMFYQSLLESDDPYNSEALSIAYARTYDLRKWGFRQESKVVPRVTAEWRKLFGDSELPFGLIVPPGSELNTLGQHHREMRELQRLATEDDPHADIIIPGTEHIPFSGQPADDLLLASRCASWIQGAVYKKPDTAPTGPMFDRMEASFNEATIHYNPGTASGLKATGNALDYFEVAGVTGDYRPAKAKIDGDVIRLTSDSVTRITRVRYNWNSRPDQQLVNQAGLPALPFRSERAAHEWKLLHEENDLPMEYSTPANQWPDNDVTLINVALEGVGYDNFTGWIGPAGFKAGPFGPNMGVREIIPGSPADGKLRLDDVIYSANGRMLGEKPWEVMAAAITEAETREGGGRLVLGVRRGLDNIDLELKLEVMGSYSPTAPFDCPKTEKIVKGVEAWTLERGGTVKMNKKYRNNRDFLYSDSIFLLATGRPEHLGYVRRAVYEILENEIKPGPLDGRLVGKSWFNSAEAFFLGEYYLATGDRKVLAHLKYACDKLTASQQPEGGWRHNYPGGFNYGYIPTAGLPGVMGMHFAKLAGCEIDLESYKLGLHHFKRHRAETAQIIYGKGQVPRPIPKPIDPEALTNGTLDSYNGAVSAAGILMRFIDDYRSAHFCSLISTYAFNQTHHGHGGNFWNNFWTPLGAHQHSKEAYIHFWKNHRWYRELSRMYDGSLIGGGRPTAGYGVALVAPRRRIQIVGAPPSPFTVDAPPALRPALEAYRNKDYAGCQTIVRELIEQSAVTIENLPTAEYLARAAADAAASIEADLARMAALIDAGDPATARSFLPGLEGVMAEDDERLTAMRQRLEPLAQLAKSGKRSNADGPTGSGNPDLDLARIRQLIDAGQREAAIAYIKAQQAAAGGHDPRLQALKKKAAQANPETQTELPAELQRQWACLIMQDNRGRNDGAPRGAVATAPDAPNLWKLRVVESIRQAPEAWSEAVFDDSDWHSITLPNSWRLYHTALLRTHFEVEDKEQFDALRLHSWVLRQQGVAIYLNGELIAKINGAGKTGHIAKVLKSSALQHLKNGRNTLAIKTRQNWRWGRMFMDVYNDGFDFNLDARLKPETSSDSPSPAN